MLPQGLLGHLSGPLADGLHLVRSLRGEQRDGVLHAVCHLGVVVIRAVQHLYPVLDAVLMAQALFWLKNKVQNSSMAKTLLMLKATTFGLQMLVSQSTITSQAMTTILMN